MLNIYIIFLLLPILLISASNHHTEETVTEEKPADVKEEVTPQSNVDKVVSGLKGLWKDFFTKYFVEKYHKLEDFFSSSKRDLQEKVEDTQRYIALVEQRQRDLIVTAKNETKKKAQKVSDTMNDWLQDVSTFKTQVKNSAKSEYEDLENIWKTKMTDKWNNGLETVIELSQKAKLEDEDQLHLITSFNVTNT